MFNNELFKPNDPFFLAFPSPTANLYLTSLACFWNLKSTELLLHFSNLLALGEVNCQALQITSQIAQVCSVGMQGALGRKRPFFDDVPHALSPRENWVCLFHNIKLNEILITNSSSSNPFLSVGKLDLKS